MTLRTLPSLSKFVLMNPCPSNYKAMLASRQSSFYYESININDSFIFTVQSVEMRRIMVAEIYVDDNAVESTEFRHYYSARMTSSLGTLLQRTYL